MKKTILTSCLLLLFMTLMAQDSPTLLTSADKKETIDSISTILERVYVFPDIGKEVAQLLRKKLKEGQYDSIKEPHEMAEVLTKDIRAINDDRHLNVNYNPRWIAERRQTITRADSIAYNERRRRNGELNNHGFREVKILDGNIGYLNLSGFYRVNEAYLEQINKTYTK